MENPPTVTGVLCLCAGANFYTPMHAQNHEDDLIIRHIESLPPESGLVKRFIDIGGYDPVVMSNTRCLVEKGWGGVYVEPAPDNALRFLREYRFNREILLVNAAVVASDPVLAKFWDSNGDAVGSTSEAHVAKWEAGSGVRFAPYLTKQISVDELFAAVGHDFSVLSLDVESVNLALFQVLPLDQLTKLKVLVVEHDGNVDIIRRRMTGWRELALNGENLVFARD